MNLTHRTALLAVMLLSPQPFLRAQATADPSGHWEGAIHAPFGEVNIEVDLAKNGAGAFVGTYGNLNDNLKGFPLANIAIEGRSVRMELKANGGGTFEGTLSAGAKSIPGTFITAEGGFSVAFDLTRTGDAKMELAPKSPPIGKQLEGTWNGTMEVDGTQRRYVLTMLNQPDGASTGNIVDVNDGLKIPVSNIKQKASDLTFDAVGGSYSGTLDPEGVRLAGTYRQGALALPLVFQRAAATKDNKN
jgi:hypothetical protein